MLPAIVAAVLTSRADKDMPGAVGVATLEDTPDSGPSWTCLSLAMQFRRVVDDAHPCPRRRASTEDAILFSHSSPSPVICRALVQ